MRVRRIIAAAACPAFDETGVEHHPVDGHREVCVADHAAAERAVGHDVDVRLADEMPAGGADVGGFDDLIPEAARVRDAVAGPRTTDVCWKVLKPASSTVRTYVPGNRPVRM